MSQHPGRFQLPGLTRSRFVSPGGTAFTWIRLRMLDPPGLVWGPGTVTSD